VIVPEKPGLDELTHHGIKGMKWGVHKREDTSSGSGGSSTPAVAKSVTPQQKKQIAALHENHQRFQEKFNPPGVHGLSDGQKKAAKIAAGAAAAALIVGGGYYLGKNTGLGKNLTSQFMKQSTEAQTAAWANRDHLANNPRVLQRAEQHFPKGHEFSRISTAAEHKWGDATYAVASKEDHDRYLAMGFGRAQGNFPHKITFQAKGDVKIPKADTVISSLKEVMGKNTSDEEARAMYNHLSGSRWDDPTSKSLFKNLKKKGYHGLLDAQDTDVIADNPLLIFDHSVMGPKKATKLVEDDVIQAMAHAKPLSNPVKMAPKNSIKVAPKVTDISKVQASVSKKAKKLAEQQAKNASVIQKELDAQRKLTESLLR
jgi:hypothetical protein